MRIFHSGHLMSSEEEKAEEYCSHKGIAIRSGSGFFETSIDVNDDVPLVVGPHGLYQGEVKLNEDTAFNIEMAHEIMAC